MQWANIEAVNERLRINVAYNIKKRMSIAIVGVDIVTIKHLTLQNVVCVLQLEFSHLLRIISSCHKIIITDMFVLHEKPKLCPRMKSTLRYKFTGLYTQHKYT